MVLEATQQEGHLLKPLLLLFKNKLFLVNPIKMFAFNFILNNKVSTSRVTYDPVSLS